MSNDTTARPSSAAYAQSGQAIVRQGFGGGEIESRRETQGAAMAAKAQAEIQARYIMAERKPRDVDDFRVRLLKECARPGFADVAEYRKPVGGQSINGPSIRFVETAIREFRNINVETPTIYEDDDKRIVRIAVTDLEANITYNDEAVIEKFVERRKTKTGDEILSSRQNSYGDTVYRIRATEDDLANKVGAAVSKRVRNLGLRILPSHVVAECMDACKATRDAGIKADPDQARKRMIDGFSKIGVSPVDIKEYLGHEIEQSSPSEIDELRAVYQTIADGEATWQAVMVAKRAERGEVDEATPQANDAAKKVMERLEKKKAPPTAPKPA